MRHITSLSIALALLFGTVQWARPQEIIKGKGNFQVEVDFARFAADSGLCYLEMYYGIHESILSYRHETGTYSGGVNMVWEIRTDTSRVARKEWAVPHSFSDSVHFSSPQVLMGLQAVALPPGDYTVSLVTYDVLDSTRKDSYSTLLRVGKNPTDRESVSDVQFCTSIKASENKQSLFYKNTLEVIPNASRLYGTGLPVMYYYAEAYNLALHPDQQNVIVRTSVFDAMGKEVITRDKSKPRLHNSSVEVGTVNLSALKGGTYLFRLSLLDTAKVTLASTEKKFFVFKYGSPADTTESAPLAGVLKSRFAVMTAEDVEHAFDYARYISTEPEKEQWEKLTDLKGKQSFLYEFWQRRNLDPSMPVNNVEQEYYKRVEEAQNTYSGGMKEGWKSDRGRVYIVYGPADEVERFPSSSDSNPYEIWHYNSIQGGVIFVFVDHNGMGYYQLVHSTHRNELQNENWYTQYAQKMR